MVNPTAGRDWPTTLAQAQAAANGHRHQEAERILADFARRYSDSDEAVETAYWRALLRLDPTNREASPQAAVALFDTYLKSDGPLQHRTEAELLRHAAARLDALSAGAASLASSSASPPTSSASSDRTADLKAKDAEIQRLKDELAKANDELERIKKRLATPTKP
jgi:hypothetical protein